MEWLIKDKNYLAALINMLSVDQIRMYKELRIGNNNKSILDLVGGLHDEEILPAIEKFETVIFSGFEVNFEEIWL